MIGKIISHYQIIGKLGQGGMGEVFLANDTTLDRRVAVKFLPEAFAADAERLDRFGREARLLASLNHPNIAAVHGLDQEGDRRFIIMELVEGETLEKRIHRASMPLKEALDLCRQIAEGLETAHEKGIVHRDLKPANVMITAEGRVKILDFGLAKAVTTTPAADLSIAATEETEATRQGIIVGTAPYMSPEQAQGKPLDSRTDIWAFGCVLYEALSRKRTFPGNTTTEVLAKILEREPDWSQLPAAVSENIRCLLRRCLQKEAHYRLRSISDARIELEDTLAGRIPAPAAPRAPRRTVAAAALAGLLLGIIGAGAWALIRDQAAAPPQVVRFSFDLPRDQPMKPTWNAQMIFSPDGGTLAYSHSVGDADTTVFRRMGELDSKPLSDAPHMSIPVFSPDGRYVLLMDPMQSALKKVSLSGGAPLPFAGYDMAFRGDWASDDHYYWTTHYFGPIVRTPGSGGDKPETVTELDLAKQERTHRHVQVLPGGRAIVFTVSTGGISSFNDARIDLFTLDTKKRKTLIQGGFSPRYSPSGHIVYARGGSLYAVAFDPERMEVTDSRPIKVTEGVFMSTNSGAAHFDISRKGDLAYAVGKAEGGERTMLWVDRDGKAAPLPLPPASYLFPRIAPDNKLIAFEIEGVNHDLYTYDPDRGVTSKMTTDGVSHAPVWTPDGKHIAFRSWKAGTMTMWWMPADRSAPEERLTMVGARQSVVDFSPDGRYVSYNQMDPMPMNVGMGMMSAGAAETGSTGIWVLPMQGDRTPQRFATSKFIQGSGRFSPDGKWVAYCSNEALVRNEVFVQPWPGPGSKTQISSEGGTDPIWRHDGKELFYRNRDKMMAVSVATKPTFQAGKPRMLWEAKYAHGLSSSCGPPGTTEGNYDVTGDGERFLMVKDVDEDAASTRMVVVLNFAEELKTLAKAQKQK